MKYGSLLRPSAMALAAAMVVGCAGEAPTTVRIPDSPFLGTFAPPTGDAAQTASAERLEVCKKYVMTSGASVPASTTFDFSSIADPAKNQSFSITSGANNTFSCREIWLDGGFGGNVTVTEPAIDGYITTVTRQEFTVGTGLSTPVLDATTNTLTGRVGGWTVPGTPPSGTPPQGQLFLFTNTEEVNTGGCTLTQGYWKTHSIYGPASKPDAVWDLLPGGLGPNTIFYSSGTTWIALFGTPPKGGNVYIQLAHQFMAARLNILNGASTTPAVDAAITGATTFFSSGATPTTPLTNAQKTLLKGYASTLGSYNEGTIGPGHC